MRRGTRVGQAYVALHVDGSDVNREIESSIEDVDYERIGRNARGQYEKGWKDTREGIASDLVKDAEQFSESMKRIHSAVENNRAINQGIAKQLETEFKKGDLDNLFKQVGHEAGVDFGGEFGGRMRQAVLDQIQELRSEAAQKGRLLDFADEKNGRLTTNANFDSLVKAARAAEVDITREREKGLKEAERIGKELTAAFEAESKKRQAILDRELDDNKFRRFQKLANEQLAKIRINPRLKEADLAKTRAKIAASLERIDDINLKLGLDIPEREKAKLRLELAALTKDVTVHVKEVKRPGVLSGLTRDEGSVAGTVERLLGGGSRNNFFNVIGKSAGNVTHIFETLFKAGSKLSGLSSVFEKIGGALGQVYEKSALLQKIGGAGGGAVAEGFASIASTGPGAVIAVAAVATAMTILVSVMSALLALVIALAATIASALVGALVVATGALGALVVAGGLAVAMFTQLSNAQKKVLAADFGPVVERFRGLGQVLAAPIFSGGANSPVAVWAHNIDKAIRGLGPLAHIMGVAFGEAGKIITASLSGKGFQQFFAALSSSTQGLAPIIENLSNALGQFLNGVGSFFAAITPQVFQFSKYLSDLATRFANFASSPAGQNKISDFVDRALVSLHSLFGFLSTLGSVLNRFLFSAEGQQAGNTIFDKMKRGLQQFLAFLTPERLHSFFQTGVTLADALGRAIHTVGTILRDLNDAGVIDAIADLSKWADKAVTSFNKLPGPIKDIIFPLRSIGFVVRTLDALFKGLGVVIGSMIFGVLEAISLLLHGLGKLPGKFGAPFRAASKAVDEARDHVLDFTASIYDVPNDVTVKFKVDTRGAAKTINSFIKGLTGLVDPNSATKPASGLLGLLTGENSKPVKGSVTSGSGSVGGGSGIPRVGGAGFGDSSGAKDAANKAKQQADAIASIYKSIRDGIRAAAKATDPKEVHDNLISMIETMRDAAKEFDKQGKARVNAVARILKAQAKLSLKNVHALIEGRIPKSATLEDFARAREIVAARLEKANQKLADAIALRNDYRKAVTDAVKTFGALTTAQAKSIDGVEQALTAVDITSNLQDRLNKIKAFQNNLRILLAQGLSQSAYKQLLDAGVEEGGAFAQALVAGGQGAVQNVNSLVGQIDSAANQLGLTASNRLYQAGVDAAQGLVDGLNSLSHQLDSAAVHLGNTIANAVKRALGIHSPSRVMREMMGYTGDGIALGLEDQHQKVGYAAARLSDKIAVSPEVAAYAAKQGGGDVSGNKPGWVWTGDIVTPTEDPAAVANEVLNELTGRL